MVVLGGAMARVGLPVSSDVSDGHGVAPKAAEAAEAAEE